MFVGPDNTFGFVGRRVDGTRHWSVYVSGPFLILHQWSVFDCADWSVLTHGTALRRIALPLITAPVADRPVALPPVTVLGEGHAG